MLDWEKTFDEVCQNGIFETLERMGVDNKLINLCRELYKDQKFRIEMDGETSSWKTQETGIRQGCTLSPYLFLILMTAIFDEVHNDKELENKREQHRPTNHDFDEIL